MINTTITPEQIMVVHSSLGIPNIIILYLGAICLLPIITLLVRSKKISWGRFLWQWSLFSAGLGILVLFLIYAPNTILKLSDTIRSLF